MTLNDLYSAVSVDQKPATCFLLLDTALHIVSWVEWNTLLPMLLSTVLDYTSGSNDPGCVFDGSGWKMARATDHSHSLLQDLANITHCSRPYTPEKGKPLRPIRHLRIEIKLSTVSTLQYKIPQLQLGKR